MKETIQIDKNFFDDLMQLLKDSSNEGNCFASMIIKKYGIQ